MCKKVEESPDEKPFEVSEMYVFGKFGTFKTRIIKVTLIPVFTRTHYVITLSFIRDV